jgi:cytochrome c peroxidase
MMRSPSRLTVLSPPQLALRRPGRRAVRCAVVLALFSWAIVTAHVAAQPAQGRRAIGDERAVVQHLKDGQEFELSVTALVDLGRALFSAAWTEDEGGGRPLTKGDGQPLADSAKPLSDTRNFNRISGPDANSCQGCHNAPHGIAGGGGDFVTNGFELAQRFDFVTFDAGDKKLKSGTVDERQRATSLQTVGNPRSTPGLFGAGYLEMLARQITAELQAIRDVIRPGEQRLLQAKGISFGVLARRTDGAWDTTRVEGLPRPSLRVAAPDARPSLVVRPWHQSASAVSLREFTNAAFNRHHGIQTVERFGRNTDPDGDGVVNEMTRADVSAVVMFIATLPVPGRVIPNDREVETAVLNGERVFSRVGCATCHVPSLPLERNGWIYAEPGPFNPPDNLRARDGVRAVTVDLTDDRLPHPRLMPATPDATVLHVPAFTDFKLHDLGGDDPLMRDSLDQNQPVWSAAFSSGNRRFLTRRLWGAANEPPYFHHGLFTTLRQAILAHGGEALEERRRFEALTKYDQDSVIEFLKSLQVLPPGTRDLIVDEHYRPRRWPTGVAVQVR